MSYTERIILTDECSKTNRKISYLKKEGREGSYTIISNQPRTWHSWECFNRVLKEVFLPKGYPDSVSSDYLEYQTWDTLQAFCSSISGTLAMSAVMKGIGVGSSTATPISAAIAWLLKDGTGMAGSILFAWFKGTNFDTECKRWRLFADVLNDIAMFIELFIPFLMNYSMFLLLIATTLKSIVGTAGSSTRAAFITHQALRGNVADVSAKDGSQEIVTNLCAFVVGIFLLKNLTETSHIWAVMCISTFFHLICNYKAVRCLKMEIFNTERFCICLRTYFPTSVVPTVEQVNNWETIFLYKGLTDVKLCGFSIVLGASLEKVIAAHQETNLQFSAILALFEKHSYFIMTDMTNKTLYIVFRHKFREVDVLKSYFHAVLLGICLTILHEEKTLNVVLRSRKHSPIYRLKNIINDTLAGKEGKEGKEGTAGDPENRMIMLAYTTCEGFVEKEFLAFSSSCLEKSWVLNKHLLNLGEWRSEWKHKGNKEHQMKTVAKVRRLRRKGYQKDMNLLLFT